MTLLLWLACSSERQGSYAMPAAAEPELPAVEELLAPGRPALATGPSLRGTCDASAAAWVGGWLWVADDEHDVLRAFDSAGAEVARLDLDDPLGGDEKESDLEGVAVAPDGVWWIGSHDRGKGTTPAPNRQRLFRINLPSGEITAQRDDLLAIFAAHPETAAVLAATAGNTSKDVAGFSIEGLAWRDGALWVGLRAPVVDGRALIVVVDDPAGQPTVRELRRLDLGGLGIRALDAVDDTLRIVAGAPDEGPFALFTQRADEPPRRLSVDLHDLRPEALATDDGVAWTLLSDDGGLKLGGKECKKLPEAQRSARTARVAF